jgi:Tol biopolymer transport system component
MLAITKIKFLPIVFLLFALAGCGGSTTPLPEVTTAIQLTVTDSPAPTASPTPIPSKASATQISPTDTQRPTEKLEPTTESLTNLPAGGFSKDLLVVYSHENNLWLWQSDGTQSQLTDSYEAFAPKISPDGKKIAYLKGWDIYNAELWVMNIDGSNKNSLVSKEFLAGRARNPEAVGTMIGQFDWVPGQKTLAYNTIQLFEVPSSPRNNDLWLVDAETSEQTLLLEPGLGGNFTYAPDGAQIALTTPESLSIINADGSDRRDILTFPVIFTNGGWNYYPKPVWSPDSKHLRVAIPPQDALNNPNAITLVWHIPSDGSIPHLAGEFVSIPAYVDPPLISPDTNKVIFLAAAGEAFEQLELLHLDLADGSQTVLYVGNISLHNWNPDSVRFVFNQDFGADFYIGQMNTPPNNIADLPVFQNLEWSSVEQFIFTTGDYENRELRIGTRKNPSTIIAQPFGEIFTFDFYPKP